MSVHTEIRTNAMQVRSFTASSSKIFTAVALSSTEPEQWNLDKKKAKTENC